MNKHVFFKDTEATVGREFIVAGSKLGFNGTKTNDDQTLVKTSLSLHPSWHITIEQQQIYEYLVDQLQPLKPNMISLSSISIGKDQLTGDWHVKAFLRSSLSTTISLSNLELYIIDPKEQRLAMQKFDLAELGELPANSARPWIFTFDATSINSATVPKNDWALAFELDALHGHQLDLDPSWQQLLPIEQQLALEEIIETLPPLGANEVNFKGFQIKMQDNGALAAHIFIRNGYNCPLKLKELPLAIIDAHGLTIATGSFTFNPPLTIKANATKPWAFNFSKELILEQQPDFSKWYAQVRQQ